MITKTNIHENGPFRSIHYQQCTEDGKEMSHAGIDTKLTRFAGGWIPTMTVGGVGTLPQYRRQGCVRAMLEDLLPRAREFGWYVSLLHPFSFSYYRKFGYERVADTVICDMPMSALDFLPRYPDLIPLDEAKHPEDILSVFETFSKNRNLTFQRSDIGNFKKKDSVTYLYYNEAGVCEGYVITQIDNYYDGINRMVSVNLIVHEIVYLNKNALMHLLSFLRMYEGELKTVHFRDIGMTPEVDLCFKHFMDTKYDMHPDIMARVLDTEAMLRANAYPTEHGVFVLRVEDNLETVRGTYRVEYERGSCEVELLSDTAKADLTVGATALSKFFYGTDAFCDETAAYLDGVKIEGNTRDFFRAFPKRINGLYEHF
ncbi:MAG: GNAT family N-acetyltransferase [Clostridia bacterium]|nr:GNAT family N-acetyltransferase [Clostridia bacterium]